MSMCEGCLADEHWRCGMQTWCECECDGSVEWGLFDAPQAMPANPSGDRVVMLMFDKAARHAKAAIDALEDLIEALDAPAGENAAAIAASVQRGLQVVENYKAATFACPVCGATQREHVCLCEVKP